MIDQQRSTTNFKPLELVKGFDCDYDWEANQPYEKQEFFQKIEAIVTKYFYGFFHPLGRRLLAGELTPHELCFLAIQEHRYYSFTTWWNASKLAQSDTLEQQRMLHNPLLDELGTDLVDVNGEPAHSELHLRYCESLGLTRAEVLNSPLVPGVAVAVTELLRIMRERPVFESLACSNLVVERMRPVHYTKLLKTFDSHYQWVPKFGLRFYEVHATLDTEHESLGRRIVSQYLYDKRNQDGMFSAVLRSLCLRLVMYDSIDQALNNPGQVGLLPWPNFPREPWPRPQT